MLIAPPDPPPDARSLLFGPFRLVPARQLLLRNDAPVALGARALDLLVALTDRAGEVVSKDELIRPCLAGRLRR